MADQPAHLDADADDEVTAKVVDRADTDRPVAGCLHQVRVRDDPAEAAAGLQRREYGLCPGRGQERVHDCLTAGTVSPGDAQRGTEGDVDGALRFARAALELTSSADWVLLDAEARMMLARVLVVGGDAEAGATEARIALELCTAKGAVTVADV